MIPGSDVSGPRAVLSLGETLIDLIADGAGGLETAQSFTLRPGGAPANVAVGLARLGVPAAFCGVVGADPFGTRLRQTLRAEGVDTARLRATGEADTTLAFAWKDERGDGHFRILRMADRLLSIADIDAAGIAERAAVTVGSVALSADPARTAVTQAVTLAAAATVPVCFDVNLRPTLWPDAATARDACRPVLERATLIKLSLDDARFLFGAADPAQAFAALGALPAPVQVLTDGDRGAWFVSDTERTLRHVPAFPVAAVEPTGAGDAFTAALIVRLLARRWSPVEEADMRYAAAAGALATTKAGALDGLPTAVALTAFLADRAES